MRITVLGASGFVGRHLVAALQARGDTVITASLRDPVRAAAQTEGSDAVVNLAGASVSGRWTAAHKREIEHSRTEVPRQYLAALATHAQRPAQYVSASAVGYYGTSRTATFVESDGPADDFLARVCAEWESDADRAHDLGMRVAKIRTGIALGSDGGALAKLLPLFRLGAGGVVASGDQWYSWIHIRDLIGIYLRAIDGYDGALNATAPVPVTNRDFTTALAKALHRPAFIPTPAFAIQLMLGEGACIVTEGQRVLPEATLASGYHFKYTHIDESLNAIVREGRRVS
jgi:uncharacterized protein (TIGR01777 family)